MKATLFAAGLMITIASPAVAQVKGIRIRVGAGAQLQPKYIGSDQAKIAPLFHFDSARGTNQFRFKAPDDAIGFGLIGGRGFSAGPSINFQGKRRESDVGALVGTVPATVEVGGFAQYDTGSFRVRGDIRKGIGGHKGVVGSVGIDKYWRDGDRYVFSIGPRLTLSDERYQQAYFGVSPEASLATGLPAYRPNAGIHAAGLVSGLTYQFNPRLGLFGYARYDRLIGDAAKSPIVREFGSRDQYAGGLGLTYTFTVRP
ncbi:MAG: MipA/OmpV family protein [Sphingomicrobium sp.]